MIHITRDTGLDAIYGGYFLGGGGGGSILGGLETLDMALSYGGFDICGIDELDPEATVLTGSLVGSPSAGKNCITGEHCIRAYELYMLNSGVAPKAVIANESGAQSITNGWIAAAANGLPVVDGACNGRAHPTGTMGAMGLDSVDGYASIQTAVGGTGKGYFEICVKGRIESTSRLVRQASIETGGFVTVLRNPASAAYVKSNAAIGTLSMCMEIGRIFRRFENRPDNIVSALKHQVDLGVIACGTVSDFVLDCKGGFDVGSFMLNGDTEITYWNEYMTADQGGVRVATFPDLIMMLSLRTGMPICSAQVRDGVEAMLVKVPRKRLLLGKTMFLRHLYEPCETAVGKPLIKYVFG